MGNNQQTTQDKQHFLQNFEKTYQMDSSVQDPRFGRISTYFQKQAAHIKLFIKATNVENIVQQQTMIDWSLARNKVMHKNVIRLYGYNKVQDVQLCSKFTKIFFYCEYFDSTLQDELDKRISKFQYFPEDDIWLLSKQIIEAQLALIAEGFICADMRPLNIMLTPQGEVKLIDSSLFPSNLTAYSRFWQSDPQQVILSPEELIQIQTNVKKSLCDQEKSDVFNFGLMLLQISSLARTGCYHDYDLIKLRNVIIQQDLDFVKNTYSNFLANFIKLCIVEDLTSRPDFKDLQSMLEPYQREISQKIQFNPNYQVSKEALSKSPIQRGLVNPNQSKAYFHLQSSSPANSKTSDLKGTNTDESQQLSPKLKQSNNYQKHLTQFQKTQHAIFDREAEQQTQDLQQQSVISKRESHNYFQHYPVHNKPNNLPNNIPISVSSNVPNNLPNIVPSNLHNNMHSNGRSNVHSNVQMFSPNTNRSLSPISQNIQATQQQQTLQNTSFQYQNSLRQNQQLEFQRSISPFITQSKFNGVNNQTNLTHDLTTIESQSKELDQRVQTALAQSQQTLQRSNHFIRR